MLTQIVYTSRPRFDPTGTAGRRTLDTILAAARRHNAETGVTGFLMVAPERLAQVLEGDAASVGQTLKRILADPRHEAVQLLDMRLVPERTFGGWSMGVAESVGDPGARPGGFNALTAEDFVRLAAAAAEKAPA